MNIVPPPYGDLWHVAVIDERQLTPEYRAELLEWIGTFGLDHLRLAPRFAVTQNSEDGRYLLHLSLHRLDSAGNVYWDFAADRQATEPLVVEITEFPAWLPAVSHQQGES